MMADDKSVACGWLARGVQDTVGLSLSIIEGTIGHRPTCIVLFLSDCQQSSLSETNYVRKGKCICIFEVFKGASTSQVIGARNEMMRDDNDSQMIFGDLESLKLPDICLTGEEKPRKNLTQETCPDRGSNPGPLRDKRACYHLLHSGGQER